MKLLSKFLEKYFCFTFNVATFSKYRKILEININQARSIDQLCNAVISKFVYSLLVLFILIFIFFYYKEYYSYIFLILAAISGCIIFIVLDRFSHKQSFTFSFKAYEGKKPRIFLITSTLFFIFFGLSLLALTRGFYTKTVLYYICISLCAGAIASEILYINNRKHGTLNLFKSFLLIFNITLSNQVLYPYGISLPDMGFHFPIVTGIISDGYIPHTAYEYFPCHHILAVANILVCNSNSKMTYLYLGGFVICLGLFFVFMIGNKFVNLQFGLFAALFYVFLDYLIMYGAHPEHQAFNYFLSIILFSVILYIHNIKRPEYVIIYIILLVSMVFTHHMCAMISLILLLSFIFNEVVEKIKTRSYRFKYFGLAILFTTVLFWQWIYLSNRFKSFLGILYAYQDAFRNSAENIVSATSYDQISITTIFLNTIGSSMLIALSVIGFAQFVKCKTFFSKSIITSSFVISFLLGIGIVFKVVALLPDRLYPFLQLFGLVFLASGGIIFLLNNIILKKSKLKYLLIIFILCFSFFSSSSTITGFETSPFVGNEVTYYKLYDSAQETFFDNWRKVHLSESNNFLLAEKSKMEILNIPKGSFYVFNKFYLITGYISNIGGHLGAHKFIKMSNDNFFYLDSYNKCYTNNMIELYNS
jgi:hypothetical protein